MLGDHLRKVHPTEVDNERKNFNFLCDLCSNVFRSEAMLHNHKMKCQSKSAKKIRKIGIQIRKNGIQIRKNGIQNKEYVHSISCSSCDEKFNGPNLYITHYQSKHEG